MKLRIILDNKLRDFDTSIEYYWMIFEKLFNYKLIFNEFYNFKKNKPNLIEEFNKDFISRTMKISKKYLENPKDINSSRIGFNGYFYYKDIYGNKGSISTSYGTPNNVGKDGFVISLGIDYNFGSKEHLECIKIWQELFKELIIITNPIGGLISDQYFDKLLKPEDNIFGIINYLEKSKSNLIELKSTSIEKLESQRGDFFIFNLINNQNIQNDIIEFNKNINILKLNFKENIIL